MTADRWTEIERICLAALELSETERAAFVDETCLGDPDLRREVESLLAGQPIADALLAVPALEVATHALAAGDGPLARGICLGPYEIEGLIAAGGMGEVYRALDLRLRREVAVKVLPPEFAADAERLRRFQTEARAIAALNHPNILAIYDIGVSTADPGRAASGVPLADAPPIHYLVTELLEGETLRDRIARGPLPIAGAIDVALQTARALAAAHGKQIVHRDLKPSNVFLTRAGQVKLLDFGIAKIVAPGAAEGLVRESEGTLTAETGPRMGTVGYMSPEQVRGLPVDPRSDIFSLGAVLYEMLAGRRAFAGGTAEDTLSAILKDEPPPLVEARGEAQVALRSLVSRCLAKPAEDRYQSADVLARELAALSSASVEPRRSYRLVLAAVALFVMAMAGGTFFLLKPASKVATVVHDPAATKHARTSIAVLPFQNLSSDSAPAYFAGGLHDELLIQLSKVAALRPIARTSVMGYLATTKTLPQIADELDVGTIVEGTVRVVAGEIRVSVKLVDTTTGIVLWGDSYDRPLNDAFAIQREIAQKVVAGVGAVLSNDEQAWLAAAPTRNPEAYRLYLQGRQYYWYRAGSLRTNLRAAEQLYEMALAEDPGFAIGHAELSMVHGDMYWFRYDASPQRAARQREEAEAALRLAPTLPQAHFAIGLAHYQGRRDYRGALEEFRIALRGMPNDALLWSKIAGVNRRLGNWNEVLAAYANAIRLNPRSADLFYDFGGETFALLHRYPEAVDAYDRALALAPDMHQAAYRRAWAYILWQGQLGPMRDMLNHLPEGAELGGGGSVAAQRAAFLLLERDADRLLQIPEVKAGADLDGHVFFLPGSLYRGWAHQLRGDASAARAAFDVALVRLDAVVRELPTDWRIHAARGLALAGLGRKQEAWAEASWIRECDVYRRDAHFGTMAAEVRARILAQSDGADAALDEIERLLPGPSWLSVHTLRLDPRWDPIRAHPRFQALLKRYGS